MLQMDNWWAWQNSNLQHFASKTNFSTNWNTRPKGTWENNGLSVVLRPTKEDLFKLVWEKPTLQLAKDFGVSDQAISKWCKIYQISKPPRGYWTKKLDARAGSVPHLSFKLPSNKMVLAKEFESLRSCF